MFWNIAVFNEIRSFQIWENSNLFCVKKTLKYHNSNCSTKHTDLVGAEPGIVHKNAGYLPWDHSAKFSAGQCHSTNVNNNFEYDGLQPTNIYDLLLKMIQCMNYYICICMYRGVSGFLKLVSCNWNKKVSSFKGH
jgi:hypothetical protein